MFVSKTSWRRLQNMSSKCLQDMSSRCLLRDNFLSFQDVLRGVFMTSWRRLGRQKIVTLKTCWRPTNVCWEEIWSYLPVKFVNFFKNRLIFNIFYCFWMFVNKLFTCLTCAYLKSKRCFKDWTQYFCMLFLNSNFFYILFSCKIDIVIIGKLNDWTLFTYKNSFRLFSRKAEIAKLGKPTRLTTRQWVPVPKAVVVIPLLISSYSAYIYLQKRIAVYDLIEYISCYFKICPQKFILIFSYLQEVKYIYLK